MRSRTTPSWARRPRRWKEIAVHTELQKHLDRWFGASGWTNGTVNGTVASATVSPQRLEDIIRAAKVTGYEVSLSAGTLTVAPKT